MTTTSDDMVFIIDDDFVLAAVLSMLKSLGLQAEAFGTAQQLLCGKRTVTRVALFLDRNSRELAALDLQRCQQAPLAGVGQITTTAPD
jgi:FixJ family two-component response regulator